MKAILLIDDDDLVRFSIKDILLRAGYNVFEAKNGREGISSVNAELPDLVITDILMPEMDGIEVIVKMNKINQGSVPVLAISGGGNISASSYVNTAKKLGAKAVLIKPFEADELLGTVSLLLEA